MKERILGLLAITLILTMFMASVYSVHAIPSVTVSLNPTEDTYVDSSSPNTNYGMNTYLEVQSYAEQNRFYLKFDLTPYAGYTITSAILSLRCSSTNSFDVTWLWAIGTGYNTWGENTTTWNNKPSSNLPLYNSTIGNVIGWNNASVLSIVNYDIINQAGIVNIDGEAMAASVFNEYFSRNSAFSPVLYLTYIAPTYPGKYLICTFNNAGGDVLTNFTVPINVSSSLDVFWNYVNSSAYDVCFFASDNTTELYYETEYWNYAAKSCLFWVRIPSISASSSGFIYLYYDYPIANSYTAYDNSSKVWTQWDSVWHLNGTTGYLWDVSPNGYQGIAGGSPTRNVSGIFDGSVKFNQTTNDYIEVSQNACGNFTYTDAFTLDVWVNASAQMRVFGKMVNGGTFRGYNLYVDSSGYVTFLFSSNYGSNDYILEHVVQNVYNSFHHVVITSNGNHTISGTTIYIDGVSKAINIDHDALTATTVNVILLDLGALGSGQNIFDAGIVDEARTIKTNLTAGWVSAEYKCGVNTFVTISIPKYWYNAEKWNGHLHTLGWYNPEKWSGIFATGWWTFAEKWQGTIFEKAFNVAEKWIGIFSTPLWNLGEMWNPAPVYHTVRLNVSAFTATNDSWTDTGVPPYLNAPDVNYITKIVYPPGFPGLGNASGWYVFQSASANLPGVTWNEITNINLTIYGYGNEYVGPPSIVGNVTVQFYDRLNNLTEISIPLTYGAMGYTSSENLMSYLPTSLPGIAAFRVRFVANITNFSQGIDYAFLSVTYGIPRNVIWNEAMGILRLWYIVTSWSLRLGRTMFSISYGFGLIGFILSFMGTPIMFFATRRTKEQEGNNKKIFILGFMLLVIGLVFLFLFSML